MTAENPLPHSLQKDLAFYREPMLEISRETRERKISEYPIFIAHQHEVSLGEVILDRLELQREWTINASVMEEFVEKGVIQKNKVEIFKKAYKNPEKYICIFIVVPEGGSFVFLPADGNILKSTEKLN